MQPTASLTLAEGLSSYHSYTLKASLRRYSSLAISSATQPGISGMATWMTYFRRIAKCCKPPRPQRDTQHTVPPRHNGILPLPPVFNISIEHVIQIPKITINIRKYHFPHLQKTKKGRPCQIYTTANTSNKTMEMMVISGLSQGNRR